ncbi:MAG: hypothetical protein ACJAZO_001958 [Myxococcota bacterium]|jgi:hypothetical protein
MRGSSGHADVATMSMQLVNLTEHRCRRVRSARAEFVGCALGGPRVHAQSHPHPTARGQEQRRKRIFGGHKVYLQRADGTMLTVTVVLEGLMTTLFALLVP